MRCTVSTRGRASPSSRLSRAAMLLTALSGAASVHADEVCDDFPEVHTQWNFRLPRCGATLSLTEKDGYARVHLPDGPTNGSDFDSWLGVDFAPTLERTDMGNGDWTISTRVEFEFPPTGTNYHVGLVFFFGPRANNDAVFWGEYTGNGILGIERSGNNIRPTYVADPGPVSLQVQKIGNAFHFRHRTDDGLDWIEDVMYTTDTGQPLATDQAVTAVGLVAKTWGGAVGAPDVLADFDYFCLETPGPLPVAEVPGPIPQASPITGLSCSQRPDGTVDLAWSACDDAGGDVTVRIAGELVRTLPAGTTSVAIAPPIPGGSIVNVSVDNAFGRQAQCTIARAIRDICDEFTEDPLSGGDWVLRLPFAPANPPSVNVDDNPDSLRFRTPSAGEAGQHFDNWVGVDLAPTLERYDMGELDWTIATRLSFPEEFGSPAGTHHVGLMFAYGLGAPDDSFNDVTYWGQYGAAGVLRVERTGAAITPQITYDGAPVSLQIQKSGNTVTFSHRQQDTDPWINDAQYAIALPYPANGAASPPAGTPVSRVGLITKTWGGGAPEVVADFDYFCLTVLDSPPIARISATPITGVTPLEVTFSAAGSLDPSGGPLTYSWDFGDGSPAASGVEVRHTYAAGGAYTVKLVATDNERNSGEATTVLELSDDPAPLTFSRIGTQGLDATVTVDKSGATPVYCIKAGGTAITSTGDHAFLLHRAIAGDFVVKAKLTSGSLTAARARFGLMARASLESRVANAAMLLESADDGFVFQTRRVDNQTTNRLGGPIDPPRGAFPVWVQLERQGTTFIGSISTDGTTFTEYARDTVEGLSANELLVGLAATSGDARTREDYCGELDFGGGPPPGKLFHRGDADQNGVLQLTDAVQILSYLFLGTATRVPECFDAADADDNGVVQLTDAVRILGFLFLGNAPPAPPGPPPDPCGVDPTDDELVNADCTYESC